MPVGHVEDLGDEMKRPAYLVPHEGDAHHGVHHGVVRSQVPSLDHRRSPLAREHAAGQFAVGLDVVGVDQLRPRSPVQLLTRPLGQRAERVVGAQQGLVGSDDGHADRGVVEGAREAGLAPAQRFVSPLAIGDLQVHDEDLLDRP